MSKLVKFLAIAALVGGALAMTPAPASGAASSWRRRPLAWRWRLARRMAWRLGRIRPGFALGFGSGWGWYGYPVLRRALLREPACGWVARARLARTATGILRRAWRC